MTGVSTDLAVVSLGDPVAADAALCGGKAAALAALAARYRVPPGFVVTTAAEGWTPALRELLLAAYEALGSPAVAVRSSAVDEDGADASFAGQHETFLNVRGPVRLIETVDACWASVRSARALAYRRTRGLDDAEPRIAVLVQELVAADVSAVVFSTNPVTGAAEVVVNASFGLGEPIVGGTVTPDEAVVSRPDLRIASYRVGAKERLAVAVEGGTLELPMPDALAQRRALSDDEVLQLARLSLDLERETGRPVDVEAAFCAGELFLLQCRPITTCGRESR